MRPTRETTPTRTPAICIIGLASPGMAIGSALQRVKSGFVVLGHDRDPDRAREAGRVKAVDDLRWNLIDAASEADLVFLCEPSRQSAETLERIAPHLDSGALVTGAFSPMLPVMELASRVLPSGVSYVAGHPIARRGSSDPGQSLVGADYCLAALPDTADQAVRVMTDLVSAIGARPYFIDAAEHDALVVAVDQLPYIVEAALTRLLADSPSVRDLRRLSPRQVMGLESAGPVDREAVSDALLASPGATVGWLRQLIVALNEWQQALEAAEAAGAADLIDAAEEARARWATEDAPPDRGEVRTALDEINPLRDMLIGRGFRRKGDMPEEP